MGAKILKYLNNPNSKTLILAKNISWTFVIKGVSLCVSFFSTPIFIHYFNDNAILGLWYTLLSILTWVLTFDLGIGNGLRNHLVRAISINDRNLIKKLISSALFNIILISLCITLLISIIIYHLNLNLIFNISPSEVSIAVVRKCTIIVFITIMCRFVLTTISSIIYALQKSAINNFISLCISLLLFIYILAFHFDNPAQSLINLSYAYLLISNIPLIIAGVWVFYKYFSDCIPDVKSITKDSTRKIMGIGFIFFCCQIFYLILSNTNEFFISHYWSTKDTVIYSFYYRINMLIGMIVSLAMTPTWSMITKAYAEKDFIWLNKLYRSLKFAGLAIIVFEFMIVPFLQFIMNLWLGKGEIVVETSKAIAFACFGASFVYSSILSTIVCGLARMKLQFYVFGIGSIFKIIGIILLARYSQSWIGVVWLNVFILFPYCILQQFSINKLFKRINEK